MPLKQFSAFSAPAAEAMWPTFHDSKVTEFPRKPAKKPVRSWVKQPVKVSVDLVLAVLGENLGVTFPDIFLLSYGLLQWKSCTR